MLNIIIVGARQAPVVPYSDTEILKLLFEMLDNLFWKDPELADLLTEETSPEDIAKFLTTGKDYLIECHIKPLTEENLDLFNCCLVESVTLLLCFALKNATGATELESLLQEAEIIGKHYLMLLECTSLQVSAWVQLIQKNFLLLFGCLLQGCSDQGYPEDHQQLYSQASARILLFLLALMQIPKCKAKDFYEKQIEVPSLKQCFPEFTSAFGINIAELMKIISTDFIQLLQDNAIIIKELDKLSKEHVEELQEELKKHKMNLLTEKKTRQIQKETIIK